MKTTQKQFFAIIATGLVLIILAIGLYMGFASKHQPNNQANNNAAKVSTLKVTVIIDQQAKSYQVTKGINLLDFATKQLAAKDNNGLITAVGSLHQDETAKAYILFKVNGKVSSVGANDVVLKDGDKVEFYIEKY
ncbi:MAG: DUF4430 domain-containing protein [Lactobacillaceae bacterium]|jgi:hypothetical protein|nr:DUF4430 domain-containing protein [Lactobacillaceae bacterium]